MLPLTELVLEECVGAAYHCMSTLEVRNEVLECVLVMGAKIYIYMYIYCLGILCGAFISSEKL